jgi:hypothetical protein
MADSPGRRIYPASGFEVSLPPPDDTVPDQNSKWLLEHRWDISHVYADMVREFKAKYSLK